MDEELIRAEIESGLKQVNKNFLIGSFSCVETNRHADVVFTFNDGDTETEVEIKWD